MKKEIIVRYVAENKYEQLWELYEPLVLQISNGSFVFIPKGFQTDFASVPKIFWSIIPSIGKYNLASVLHDYLYTETYVSRDIADKEFLFLMNKTDSKHKIRNYIMYICVRLFGAKRYNFYKKTNTL